MATMVPCPNGGKCGSKTHRVGSFADTRCKQIASGNGQRLGNTDVRFAPPVMAKKQASAGNNAPVMMPDPRKVKNTVYGFSKNGVRVHTDDLTNLQPGDIILSHEEAHSKAVDPKFDQKTLVVAEPVSEKGVPVFRGNTRFTMSNDGGQVAYWRPNGRMNVTSIDTPESTKYASPDMASFISNIREGDVVHLGDEASTPSFNEDGSVTNGMVIASKPYVDRNNWVADMVDSDTGNLEEGVFLRDVEGRKPHTPHDGFVWYRPKKKPSIEA